MITGFLVHQATKKILVLVLGTLLTIGGYVETHKTTKAFKTVEKHEVVKKGDR